MARFDHREVQRLRFALESTFGADATGDVASNFYDLRHKPTVIARETAMAPDETVVQRFRQRHKDVAGPRRGQCALEAYWTPTGQALDAAATPAQRPQSRFLEHVFGGYRAAAGSLVASGAATTGAVVTSTEGGRFADNTIVAVELGSTVLPRLLETRSTDTLVWWPALPSTPEVGGDVLNAQVIYFDDTTETWVQLLSETALDRGNVWLLKGGAAHEFRLSLARGGLLTWSCTVQGAVVEHDDELAVPQGGGALGAADYPAARPVWGTLGGCHFGPSADSTLSMVRCVELEIDPGVAWIETGDHAGVEGVGEWHRDRARTEVTLTVLRPATGAYEAWHDAWRAETDYGFLFWIGASGGAGLAIGGRTGQIIKVEPVEWSGLEAQKITLLMRENAASSDGAAPTTALRASPIVIGHW